MTNILDPTTFSVFLGGMMMTLVGGALAKNPNVTWWLTLLSLVGALAACLIQNSLQVYFSCGLILMVILSHVGARAKLRDLSAEFSPAVLGFTAACFAIVNSDNLLIYVMAVPVCFFFQGCAPELVTRQKSKAAVNAAAVRALLFLVVLSWGTCLLYKVFGTMRLSEIKSASITASSEQLFWAGWACFLSVALAWLPASASDAFGQKYEEADSWPVWVIFRMGPPLVATYLCMDWILILQNPVLLKLVPDGFGSQMLPRIGLYVFLALAAWNLFQLFLASRLSRVLHPWLFQPLALVFLGTGVQDRGVLSWSLAGIALYAVGVPLVALGAQQAKWRPRAIWQDCVSVLSKTDLGTKVQIFVGLWALTPLATVAGYHVLSGALKSLSSLSGATPASPEGVITLSVLALSMMSTGVQVFLLAKLFNTKASSPDLAAKDTTRDAHVPRVVAATALIVFIILGIYPTPLYNYLVSCFSKFSWLAGG